MQAFVEAHDEWVIDGNASKIVGDLTFANATDIICLFCSVPVRGSRVTFLSVGLDPPLIVYFPRVFWRTVRRILGGEESCAAGCRESWARTFWDRESILLWSITGHRRAKERNRALIAADGGARWKILGGWGSVAKAWWERVEELAINLKRR